jgi:Zn-dependent M28 family amino/carboxypeptidase
VTFLATTGEEYGKLGAVHYKERREKEGTLNNIKVVYELDSLTWGNNLQLSSSHRKFTELIAESNNAVKINGTPQIFDKDSGGDLRPFRQAGIPTVFVNSRGKEYEPKTLHLWHRPEDTPDGVHPELIENGFLVFQEAIRRLQES